MSTLADLKARIADELARADLTSQIALAIEDAVAFHQIERWAFEETDSAVPTIAGTASYALPADFIRPVIFRLQDSGGDEFPLVQRSYEWFRAAQTDAADNRGLPTDFALWGDEVWLYPTPDQVYTAHLSYIGAVDAPPGDLGENAWTNIFEPLIRAEAKRDLYLNVIREPESAALMEREVARLRMNRKWRSYLARGTGRVRPMGH